MQQGKFWNWQREKVLNCKAWIHHTEFKRNTGFQPEDDIVINFPLDTVFRLESLELIVSSEVDQEEDADTNYPLSRFYCL